MEIFPPNIVKQNAFSEENNHKGTPQNRPRPQF
jgi:hypothetical protein